MPIYEYRCGGCGHTFELLVRPSSQTGACPACGGSEIERLLSLPSVRSDQTRRRAAQGVRARNRATRTDQADAEAKRIEAHSRDHDE